MITGHDEVGYCVFIKINITIIFGLCMPMPYDVVHC